MSEATVPLISLGEPEARAKRYNAGKPRFDLIPPAALKEVAMVFTKGAAKYGDRNWQNSINTPEHEAFRDVSMASLLRHVNSYQQGEMWDEESVQHHMAHVVANALFIMTYDMERRDD